MADVHGKMVHDALRATVHQKLGAQSVHVGTVPGETVKSADPEFVGALGALMVLGKSTL